MVLCSYWAKIRSTRHLVRNQETLTVSARSHENSVILRRILTNARARWGSKALSSSENRNERRSRFGKYQVYFGEIRTDWSSFQLQFQSCAQSHVNWRFVSCRGSPWTTVRASHNKVNEEWVGTRMLRVLVNNNIKSGFAIESRRYIWVSQSLCIEWIRAPGCMHPREAH